MSTLRGVVASVVLALVVGGCSGAPGADGYLVTATFPEAVALYEESRVRVMGFDVGIVESVDVLDDEVAVTMRIDDDVPLPADVEAALVPFTIIGERNILLFPAWQPGDDRAADGTAIPPERTRVPVEVDDALAAFIDLTDAVDADAVRRLLSTSATALAGEGERFGRTLDEVAGLVSTVDALDTQVLALADEVSDLAETVTDREDQLVRLLDTVADAADVVVTHQADTERLFRSLRGLNTAGRDLLDGYEEQLPRDLARLADLGLVLRANTGAVQFLVDALERVGGTLQDAFSDETQALVLRVSLPQIIGPLLEGLLEELLGAGAS